VPVAVSHHRQQGRGAGNRSGPNARDRRIAKRIEARPC
jgi:hypothetical protein